MKKLFFVFLSVIVLLPVAAENRDRAIVLASSNDKLQVETLSRIGYGFHFVKSSEFKPSAAGEFFFNFVQLDVFPTEFLEIQFGLDCEFNHYTSKSSYFFLDSDRKVQVTDFQELDKANSRFRGGVRTFNINAPLMVKGIFGFFQVGVGIEGSLNLAGKAYYNHRVGNTRDTHSEAKAALNLFSFGLVAGATYDDFGFYVKFYPKPSRVLAPGSVDFSYWTLGVTFGL
jgi:hypothetical protein